MIQSAVPNLSIDKSTKVLNSNYIEELPVPQELESFEKEMEHKEIFDINTDPNSKWYML